MKSFRAFRVFFFGNLVFYEFDFVSNCIMLYLLGLLLNFIYCFKFVEINIFRNIMYVLVSYAAFCKAKLKYVEFSNMELKGMVMNLIFIFRYTHPPSLFPLILNPVHSKVGCEKFLSILRLMFTDI